MRVYCIIPSTKYTLQALLTAIELKIEADAKKDSNNVNVVLLDFFGNNASQFFDSSLMEQFLLKVGSNTLIQNTPRQIDDKQYSAIKLDSSGLYRLYYLLHGFQNHNQALLLSSQGTTDFYFLGGDEDVLTQLMAFIKTDNKHFWIPKHTTVSYQNLNEHVSGFAEVDVNPVTTLLLLNEIMQEALLLPDDFGTKMDSERAIHAIDALQSLQVKVVFSNDRHLALINTEFPLDKIENAYHYQSRFDDMSHEKYENIFSMICSYAFQHPNDYFYYTFDFPKRSLSAFESLKTKYPIFDASKLPYNIAIRFTSDADAVHVIFGTKPILNFAPSMQKYETHSIQNTQSGATISRDERPIYSSITTTKDLELKVGEIAEIIEPTKRILPMLEQSDFQAQGKLIDIFEDNSRVNSAQQDTTLMSKVFNLSDYKQKQLWAKEGGFEYVEDPTYVKHERHLNIGIVAVLNSEDSKGKVWGVFADTDLNADTVLGEYLGDKVKFSKVVNRDYMFRLSEEKEDAIDARSRRNWTAIVNSASSASEANMHAYNIDNHILYKTVKPIKKDEQFLIYYGENYPHDRSGHFRFLTPRNSWRDSNDLIHQYNEIYHNKAAPLPEGLAALFGLRDNPLFKHPDFFIDSQTNAKKRMRAKLDENYFNLPLLLESEEGEVACQNKQENITPLMIACWNGDVHLVDVLLQKKANPNMQTTIHGFTAMHILIAAPDVNVATKIEIINLLRKHKASLHLQDLHDKSVLHWAIDQKEIELIDKLCLEDYSMTHQEEDERLLNCENDNGLDPFLYAIQHSYEEAFDVIANYITAQDIAIYIKNNTLILSSNPQLKKKQLDILIDIVKDDTQSEYNVDKWQISKRSLVGQLSAKYKANNKNTTLTNDSRVEELDSIAIIPSVTSPTKPKSPPETHLLKPVDISSGASEIILTSTQNTVFKQDLFTSMVPEKQKKTISEQSPYPAVNSEIPPVQDIIHPSMNRGVSLIAFSSVVQGVSNHVSKIIENFKKLNLTQDRYSMYEPDIRKTFISALEDVLNNPDLTVEHQKRYITEITQSKINEIKIAAIDAMRSQSTIEGIVFIEQNTFERIRLYLIHSGFAIQYLLNINEMSAVKVAVADIYSIHESARKSVVEIADQYKRMLASPSQLQQIVTQATSNKRALVDTDLNSQITEHTEKKKRVEAAQSLLSMSLFKPNDSDKLISNDSVATLPDGNCAYNSFSLF